MSVITRLKLRPDRTSSASSADEVVIRSYLLPRYYFRRPRIGSSSSTARIPCRPFEDGDEGVLMRKNSRGAVSIQLPSPGVPVDQPRTVYLKSAA
jgi:hypothetical protein